MCYQSFPLFNSTNYIKWYESIYILIFKYKLFKLTGVPPSQTEWFHTSCAPCILSLSLICSVSQAARTCHSARKQVLVLHVSKWTYFFQGWFSLCGICDLNSFIFTFHLITSWYTWMIFAGIFLPEGQCYYTRTHTHTHRCKSLSHPCCLKTWNQGRGGWRNGVNEQLIGIGDLWVIKSGCGLVCTSSANPLSDKTESSVHQLWTPTHYILSIPFIASSILLLHSPP